MDCWRHYAAWAPGEKKKKAGRALRAQLEGGLLELDGARVSHPQQLGLPDERTKLQGFWDAERVAPETGALRRIFPAKKHRLHLSADRIWRPAPGTGDPCQTVNKISAKS